MRVAYVSMDPGVPVFGCKGCSIHVQEIVRALRHRGAHVTLVASRLGGLPPADLRTVTTRHLSTKRCAQPEMREQKAIDQNHAVDAMLRDEGPFELIYERHSIWSHAAMEYARDHRIPSVLEVNAPLIDEQSAYRCLVDVDAARRSTARAFAAADNVIAVSPAAAQYPLRFGMPTTRLHVVPNGVDARRFADCPAAISDDSHKPFTVGFVGSLKPWHGITDLLSAYVAFSAGTPDTRLLIVGDGPQRDPLERQLSLLDRRLAETVCLTGAVPHHTIPDHLSSMSVAVAPYGPLRQNYFSPLKIYEYMAAGLPIVAAATEPIAAAIEHGRNGLLYTPGSKKSLLAALHRIRNNPPLARRLASNAQQDVRAHHTWRNRVDQILRLAGVGSNRTRETKSVVCREEHVPSSAAAQTTAGVDTSQTSSE